MKKILVTGGTGLVGTHLIQLLKNKGFEPAILTRDPQQVKNLKAFHWDIKNKKMDTEALVWADGIIHLAGAGVADKRWTESRKEAILKSRTESTQLLYDTLEKSGSSIKAFVSASAIGYYGFVTSDRFFEESDKPGREFLADVVVKWEKKVTQFAAEGIRTAIMRIGIVLAKEGGALLEMGKPPVLAPLGSGKQWLPWIHIEDLCEAFVWALENETASGPYNTSGCQPVTNEDFTKTLAQVKGKLFIPIGAPGFIMKVALGEMAGMILEGSRMSYEKITAAGFKYKHTKLKPTLKDILK